VNQLVPDPYWDKVVRGLCVWMGLGGGTVFTDEQRPFRGKIDEVRITKGVGRYTSNFADNQTSFPNS